MPDFDIAEFKARAAAAQAAMEAADLDALWLTEEADVRYFTGFRTLFWESPTRTWHVILPRTGRPIAIVPEIGAALMETTWVEDIRTWPSPRGEDEGITLLLDALGALGRVGVPMGPETAHRQPLADLEAVRRGLQGDLVDASPLIRDLRMVKSPAEIDLIAQICGIASDAFDRAGELFHVGQTKSEAFRAFKIALLETGAEDVPYLVGGAGPDGYADVISPPDETPLAAGDVLMLDTGAALKGYFCDFDRNFALSRASTAATDAYAALDRATEAGLAAARPGATASEVCAAMAAELGGGSSVGRLGHGLGMRLTEWPSLAPFDQTVLRPGMVITLEPSIPTTGDAMMVQEENILITEDAPRLLSRRAAPTLQVI